MAIIIRSTGKTIALSGSAKKVVFSATLSGGDSPEQIRDKLNSLPDGFAYIHTQSPPSSTWVINHNLGYKPTAELISTGGVKIFAEIIHVSDNQIQVLSDSPLSGQLRLN
jgi:hypothetical protein